MADCLLATSISRLDSESNMAAKFFSRLKAVFHFGDSPWPFMKLSYFALGASVLLLLFAVCCNSCSSCNNVVSHSF